MSANGPDKFSTRLQREAASHDARISRQVATFGHEREEQSKYYWAVQRYQDAFWQHVLDLCRDKDVLELGCFDGSRTLELSRVAKSVVGVDISANAVRHTEERLLSAGRPNARAQIANVEQLPFEASAFDVVFGAGIVHHVDVARCAGEVYRVLRHEGCALFREPLAHNPIIRLYRALTPGARTKDEHPLTLADIALLCQPFLVRKIEYFGLLTLAAAPTRTLAVGRILRDWLSSIDEAIFTVRYLRRFAWQVAIVLQKAN